MTGSPRRGPLPHRTDRSPRWSARSLLRFAAALATLAGSRPSAAEPLPMLEPDRDQAVRFQDEVLPFLAANCVACHNAKRKEGGLSLETAAAIAAGGDSGPAVVAGSPAESILLVRAAHRDPAADPMPPPESGTGSRNLSPQELGLLARWIAEGAAAGPAAAARPIDWRPLPAGTGPVVAVDVTSDGRLLAAARGGQLSLFDAASGSEVCRLADPAAAERNADPAAAERNADPAAAERTADPAAAERTADPAAHRDPLTAVAFSPAGDRLATGSFRTIKLWRRLPPRILPLAETAAASALAVSPAGTVVALGMPDGQVAILADESGRAVKRQATHDAAITGLTFAANGDTLFALAASGAIAAIRPADGATMAWLDRPAGTAAVAAVGDGRLATAEPDGVVRIWRLPLPAPAGPGETSPAVMPERELVVARQTAPADGATATPSPLTAVAAAPGLPGHLFAAGNDGLVRLWNAETGGLVREFAHGGPVHALAVSPDGRRLATAGTAAGIRLWSVADGGLVADARGDVRLDRRLAGAELALQVAGQDVEFGTTRAAAAEKDIAAATEDRRKTAEAVAAATARVEEKRQGERAADQANQAAAADLAAARAAEPLAVAAHAAAIKAQESAAAAAEAASASATAAAKGAAEPVAVEAAKAAAAAAATARTATAATVNQAAAAIQKAKQRIAAAVKKAAEAETALTMAREERTRADTTLAVATRSVEFAELADQRARAALPARQAELESLRQRLVSARLARDAAARDAAAAARPAVAAAFSPDGRWLATLDADGRLAIFGGGDGRPRDVFDAARPAGVGPSAGLLAFAADGLIVAGAAAAAAVWDLAEAWTLDGLIGGEATPAALGDDPGGPPVGIVAALAFSPDGSVVASGSGRTSRSGEIKLWTADRGLLVRTLPQSHTDTVMALAFSSRGDQLASGGADRVIRIHAVADGGLVRSFEGHTGHVLGVAWQADGRRLASAGGDHAVKIWDTVTGQQQRTITGPRKEVTGVRFLGATGELLAASADPLVRVYDAGTGAVIRDYGGAAGFLQVVAAAPPLVAVGGHDGSVRLWSDAADGPLHVLEPAPAGP